MQKEFWQSILAELKPFDGRMAMTWRTALVCSLTAGVFMTYEVPLVAIGCYLIMFLAKPSAQENIAVAIAISLLVSFVVLLLLALTRLAIEIPMWRMIIIALGSYLFLFIGAASLLGPGGNIIALVIGFVMTLLPYAPIGELATRGILFAWLMVLIPMGIVVVFHGLAGQSAHAQIQRLLAKRCERIAQALSEHNGSSSRDDSADPTSQAILESLRTGQGLLRHLLKLIRLFHLAPRAQSVAMEHAIETTHDILTILQDGQVGKVLATDCPDLCAALSDRCVQLARMLERKDLIKAVRLTREQPVLASASSSSQRQHGRAACFEKFLVQRINQMFDSPDCVPQAIPDGSSLVSDSGTSPLIATPKPGFFKADAWTNPEYSRFAIKTTAAAILCYIIYTSIQWQGIHTAMVTCYVAALGSTGETVHKLALRITGCLMGAAMGIAALVFLMPLMTSLSQLMLLVFAGVFVAAWISSGSERISYAGIQVGLAFLMTVLQDFRPDVQLSVATDRIYGILLGNAVLFVMFTRLWPVSVLEVVRRQLNQSASDLRRLAWMLNEGISKDLQYRQDLQSSQRMLNDFCLRTVSQARESLLYSRFEPHPIRAQTACAHSIRKQLDEIETIALRLGRIRVFAAGAPGMPSDVSEQLKDAARQELRQISGQLAALGERADASNDLLSATLRFKSQSKGSA